MQKYTPNASYYPFKRTIEKFRIGYDFSKIIESGDSAGTFAVSAIDEATGDDVSGTFLASPSQAAGVVKVTVQSGTPGHDYLVFFRLDTSPGGDIFQRIVRVPVRQ